MPADLILIDNFDSFTYNLVDQFRSSGHEVTIFRNEVAMDVVKTAIQNAARPVLVLSLIHI